jgi:hypothetical protein
MHRVETPLFNRRTVVTGLCASGLVTACSSGRAPADAPMNPAQAAAQQGQALATGEMDRWARMVGKPFGTSGFTLNVAGVQPLPTSGARPAEVSRHSAFLVVFEVLSGGVMPGDLIYTMTSSTHALEVFLASAATTEFPNRMHAVFN